MKARIRTCEVKVLYHNILCKCGNGNMIGTGIVKLVDNKYQHHHVCVYFNTDTSKESSQVSTDNGCGQAEWFPDKYPLREVREVPI
jgi:quinolinate synthase